jgi:putative peptidoglycan lipid II flippase
MKPLAHGGLALATSLASMLNLGLLVHALRAKLGALGWRSIARSACKTLLSSAGMGVAVWETARVMIPLETRTPAGLLEGVVVCIAVGIGFYGLISYFLKSDVFNRVLAEARRGIGKK